MKIRSAQTLVFSRNHGEVVAFNFLTSSAFCCSHDLLVLLEFLDDWRDRKDIAGFIPTITPDELDSTIERLVEVNAVTEEESDLAAAEEEFQASWKWGIPAALFHFSVQDKKYMSLEEAEELQLSKLAEFGKPELYLRNDRKRADTLALPSCNCSSRSRSSVYPPWNPTPQPGRPACWGS